MEKMTSKDWKDFCLLNLRGCLIVAVILLGIFLYPLIFIWKDDAAHRKIHPNAATINNKLAPEYAQTIGDALNKYFADHKEYPWQIYGNASGKFPTDKIEYADPLQYGMYIGAYPRTFSFNGIFLYHYSCNLVSAPHDSVVKRFTAVSKPDVTFMTEDGIVSANAMHARRQKFRESVTVLLAAGGIRPSPERLSENQGNPGPVASIVLPAIKKDMAELFSMPDISSASALSGNFGYVRGERMGADKNTAFLWIYGMPTDRNAWNVLTGLDVINAETGELKPDGLADDVAILLELRDGKVVKTTRAQDM